MKTLKVTNALLKKQNCFIYGQKSKPKVAPDDPTVIITTTVTFALPSNA